MSVVTAWIVLFIAGIFEALWAIALRQSQEFTKVIPTIIVIVLTVLIFYMLAKVMKVLPTGIAYCAWTGMSIVIITMIEYFFFSLEISWTKVLSMFLILLGIFGLQ